MDTLGEMGDISNLCQFGWYEWVYFCHKSAAFLFQKEQLRRCLVPTKNDGNEMCQWVLHQNGQVVLRRTLRRLRSEEFTVNNETESNKHSVFDSNIKESLRDSIAPAPLKLEIEQFYPTNNFYYDENYDQSFMNIVPEADDIDKNGKPIDKQYLADLMINSEVLLPHE